MIVQRETIPDMQDHAIDALVSGMSITSAEWAAYLLFSDQVDGVVLSGPDQLFEVMVISESSKPKFSDIRAAKIYAHALAHGAVLQ